MIKNIFVLSLALVSLLFFKVNTNAEENTILVEIQTTKGDLALELYKDKAPSTVENFLSYVDEKFYDGTIFHRVIKGFMIQGGGLTPDFIEKEAKTPINNEADNGLKNKKYTIAMARTSDPHSATCQFFINHADNAFLDYTAKTVDGWGYCVFGKVIEGTDTVEAIANTTTTTAHGMRDVPTETIKIISIRRK
ncbi:MAG: peptidylprolyl isomerase [Candidatus Aminicenantes bacterium]